MIGQLPAVLAHYGGLDEVGVFVVPAVAAVLLLRWAERRARERAERAGGEPDGSDDGGSGRVDAPPVEH